jgi:NAD(P)H-dependent FMN reductase
MVIMESNQVQIVVVCGSVREKRTSIHAANFLVDKFKEKDVNVILVDFKVLPLPFVNTPEEPSKYKGVYPDKNVQAWSDIAQKADAFVIVTPEYNHGYPGVLKNALDWLYDEFARKPVGLVGVSSGLVGGARAIEQLRPIMENFSMFAIRETIMVRSVSKVFDDTGKLVDDSLLKQVPKFIDSLLFMTNAMKQARVK